MFTRIQMTMKSVLVLVAFVAGATLFSGVAVAYDAAWYKTFAQTKAFPCLHPKSKIVKVEQSAAPATVKGIESARVTIFYKGWLKKHKMEIEIFTTAIGEVPHVRIMVLHDTSPLKRLTCKMASASCWVPVGN